MNQAIRERIRAFAQQAVAETTDEAPAGSDAHAGHGGRPVLHVCGLNHVRAAIAMREHYALTPETTAELVHDLKTSGLSSQLLVLSTCNRTELYAFSARPDFSLDLREAFLSIGGGGECDFDEPPPLYEYEGLEAVRHLFAVGAGLDSMILGENQIKGQIQQAYDLSRAQGACGAELNRLIEAAHRTGKRIRTETDLNVGTLCVGKAAVLKGEQILGSLTGKICMVIGAGKIGGLAARAIAERHPGRLWIINRTMEKAMEVAAELGAEAYGLESLPCLLPEADFILGAAYAPELLLGRGLYEAAATECQRPAHVCMVDAALPRIIDANLSELAGVELFDIEHMQEITEENRRRRTSAARQAWRIVEAEVEKFRAVMQTAQLAPLIKQLRHQLDRIFEEEQGPGLHHHPDPELIARHEAMQHRIKQRLLHEVIQEIKTRLMD